ERLWQRGTTGRSILIALGITMIGAFAYLTETPVTLLERFVPGEPLEIGLGPKREAVVQTLMQYTSSDARILWEDRHRSRQASRWSALLPILTGRSYVGGLDPDGFIEHSSISLINQ